MAHGITLYNTMKKLILSSLFSLLSFGLFAGNNPVLQNPYTTNSQNNADTHVVDLMSTNTTPVPNATWAASSGTAVTATHAATADYATYGGNFYHTNFLHADDADYATVAGFVASTNINGNIPTNILPGLLPALSIGNGNGLSNNLSLSGLNQMSLVTSNQAAQIAAMTSGTGGGGSNSTIVIYSNTVYYSNMTGLNMWQPTTGAGSSYVQNFASLVVAHIQLRYNNSGIGYAKLDITIQTNGSFQGISNGWVSSFPSAFAGDYDVGIDLPLPKGVTVNFKDSSVGTANSVNFSSVLLDIHNVTSNTVSVGGGGTTNNLPFVVDVTTHVMATNPVAVPLAITAQTANSIAPIAYGSIGSQQSQPASFAFYPATNIVQVHTYEWYPMLTAIGDTQYLTYARADGGQEKDDALVFCKSTNWCRSWTAPITWQDGLNNRDGANRSFGVGMSNTLVVVGIIDVSTTILAPYSAYYDTSGNLLSSNSLAYLTNDIISGTPGLAPFGPITTVGNISVCGAYNDVAATNVSIYALETTNNNPLWSKKLIGISTNGGYEPFILVLTKDAQCQLATTRMTDTNYSGQMWGTTNNWDSSFYCGPIQCPFSYIGYAQITGPFCAGTFKAFDGVHIFLCWQGRSDGNIWASQAPLSQVLTNPSAAFSPNWKIVGSMGYGGYGGYPSCISLDPNSCDFLVSYYHINSFDTYGTPNNADVEFTEVRLQPPQDPLTVDALLVTSLQGNISLSNGIVSAPAVSTPNSSAAVNNVGIMALTNSIGVLPSGMIYFDGGSRNRAQRSTNFDDAKKAFFILENTNTDTLSIWHMNVTSKNNGTMFPLVSFSPTNGVWIDNSVFFSGSGAGLTNIPLSALQQMPVVNGTNTPIVWTDGTRTNTIDANGFSSTNTATGKGSSYGRGVFQLQDTNVVMQDSLTATSRLWRVAAANGVGPTNTVELGTNGLLTLNGVPLLTNLPAAQLTGTIPQGSLPSGVLTNNQVGPLQFYGDSSQTNSKTFDRFGLTLTNAAGQTRIGGSGLAVGTTNLPGPGSATFTNNVTASTFTGNGSGLTNVTAATNATITLAALPSGVVTNMATGVTLTGTFSGNHIGNLTSTNLQMAISTNNIVPQAGGYSLSTAIIDTNRFILSGADLTNANCTYMWFAATNGYTNSTSPLTIALATNGLYIAVSNSAFGYRTNLNTNAAVYISTASRVGQWANGYNAPTGGTNGTQQAPVGSFAYTNGLTLVVYVSTDGTNQTLIMSFGTNATVSEGTGKASGIYSHAEGYITTASGAYSHAEGGGTTASGVYSHAEGSGTTASGNYSHAEGYITTASGAYSHAEGGNTIASGNYSHAEGNYTTASGSYSHAGGYNSKATNNNTFVWSDGTVIGSATSNTVTFYVANGYRFGGGAASFDSSVSATNGFVSSASNTLALTAISFPATTVNWTNTFGKNIMLFIDNTGVTGTAAYINGSQIFGSILPIDITIPLQPGEYFSETYTVGTPTAKWKPF